MRLVLRLTGHFGNNQTKAIDVDKNEPDIFGEIRK